MAEPSPLVAHLKSVLLDLAANPFPEVANPPGAERRASVALVIRIQPTYGHWPSKPLPRRRRSSAATDGTNLSLKNKLDAFFEQDWVKYGDPEVLFIKRSTRKGDRWTGHVALPGGRRDPEDQDDQVTAVREAMEEVGIDLSYAHALAVGNLPQRVVTTSWGKVPLMVLCPYIFLLTHHDIPPLRLQPTEVASAHWVSIRALLSPELRTYEYQDVSNRLAKQEMGIKRWALRMMMGRMLFAAINLVPTESVYCSSIPGFVPEENPQGKGLSQRFSELWHGGRPAHTATHLQKPLLLWGLTLGVMADFLELMPPHTALELWIYPTFTTWDVRFTLWLMAYSFRKRKQRELSLFGAPPPALDDETPGGLEATGEYKDGELPAEVGIGGLGAGLRYRDIRRRQLSRNSAVGTLLEGYYDIVRKAVPTALIARISTIALVAFMAWKKYRKTA